MNSELQHTLFWHQLYRHKQPYSPPSPPRVSHQPLMMQAIALLSGLGMLTRRSSAAVCAPGMQYLRPDLIPAVYDQRRKQSSSFSFSLSGTQSQYMEVNGIPGPIDFPLALWTSAVLIQRARVEIKRSFFGPDLMPLGCCIMVIVLKRNSFILIVFCV